MMLTSMKLLSDQRPARFEAKQSKHKTVIATQTGHYRDETIAFFGGYAAYAHGKL